MSIVELKELLVEKIRQEENLDVLHETLRLLEMETTDVFELNQDQKNAIREAKAEIEKGDFFSNEEVEKEMEEWLKR